MLLEFIARCKLDIFLFIHFFVESCVVGKHLGMDDMVMGGIVVVKQTFALLDLSIVVVVLQFTFHSWMLIVMWLEQLDL